MEKILVIGSSNLDYILTMDKFPVPGETIAASSFMHSKGGKGANQALAAHKLGGNVWFATSLGNDTNGEDLIKYYEEQGMNALPLVIENVPTGIAMIWVNRDGENCIVINPGANEKFSTEFIYKSNIEKAIKKCDIILLQMEIPYETVKAICEIASLHDKKIMLNVAPAMQIEPEIISKTAVLVVNRIEAETISGIKINGNNYNNIIDKLLGMGATTVILTLGDEGSIVKNSELYKHVPAIKVDTVDTTAAGDTYCGALAAELARGNSWEDALEFATAASALCVTKMGAQTSIPMERDVRNFLKDNHSRSLK